MWIARIQPHILILAACTLQAASAADISGTWVAKTESPMMGEVEYVYELKADAARSSVHGPPLDPASVEDHDLEGPLLESFWAVDPARVRRIRANPAEANGIPCPRGVCERRETSIPLGDVRPNSCCKQHLLLAPHRREPAGNGPRAEAGWTHLGDASRVGAETDCPAQVSL
jgi:hypothetical protein